MIRQQFRQLPPPRAVQRGEPPARRPAEGLYDVLPADHRLPYDMEDVLVRIFDADDYPGVPAGVCAGDAVRQRASGRAGPVGSDRQPPRLSEEPTGRPRIGGIVYTESARKVAYFVENAERQRHAADLPAGRLRLHGRGWRRSAKASSARARKWWRPWPARPCRRSS